MDHAVVRIRKRWGEWDISAHHPTLETT